MFGKVLPGWYRGMRAQQSSTDLLDRTPPYVAFDSIIRRGASPLRAVEPRCACTHRTILKLRLLPLVIVSKSVSPAEAGNGRSYHGPHHR